MEDKMYLTAGELSDMLGISKQTVLYYDRIGLFSPAGRDEKGYRYYTIPQVDELDTVLSFRNMGVPLGELRDYLREKSPQRCLDLLGEHLGRIDTELQRLSTIRKKVSGKIRQVETALAITDHNAVRFEEREELPYLYQPCDATDQRRFMVSFLALCEQRKHYQIDFYNPICRLVELSDLKAGNFSQISFLGAPVQKPDPGEKLLYQPAGIYASTYQCGSYGDTAETYRRLLGKIDEMGYEVCGRAYESDVLSILTNPDGDYTIHIAVQVKRREPA
ncbi:MerR family transcriptional regulator [Harryflintia acetispora]|uniref:MerR family transcriptional regulator n=1 Tax=Harryflintia acetispora TaxID=1849041 RepID=UPI00189A8312|nr:MerR family DNA-binding transcriptional regulator [Harryflintia acetispora]